MPVVKSGANGDGYDEEENFQEAFQSELKSPVRVNKVGVAEFYCICCNMKINNIINPGFSFWLQNVDDEDDDEELTTENPAKEIQQRPPRRKIEGDGNDAIPVKKPKGGKEGGRGSDEQAESKWRWDAKWPNASEEFKDVYLQYRALKDVEENKLSDKQRKLRLNKRWALWSKELKVTYVKLRALVKEWKENSMRSNASTSMEN